MSGLEVLGVAASIIQIADLGFQLSKNIYNYIDTASSADDRLARIARNVDLTTEVVRRVAEVFESEAESGTKKKKNVVNQEALRLGRDVAGECEVVFGKLRAEVGKLMENPRRCYKFPFKESKFALWEAQLEKLKTTLNCLMNVLILAQALKENKDPSQWEETVKRLVDERDEATEKYERLRKEFEEASYDNASSSSSVLIQTTVPPPRYDQIEGSRAPGEGQKTTPPMRHLEDCIPKVQAMLDTINAMQRTLGQQSRDYVNETEIRNLWSVYWSMNDKMTDTLRKLESEHKGPKPVQFSKKKYSDPRTETRTYTETITWTRPTPVETQRYSLDDYLSFEPEDRTSFGGETMAQPKNWKSTKPRFSNNFEERVPGPLIPETRSWDPPMEYYTEETEIVRHTPMDIPVAVAPVGRETESMEVEERPKVKKKEGVVEELLRQWTTIYD